LQSKASIDHSPFPFRDHFQPVVPIPLSIHCHKLYLAGMLTIPLRIIVWAGMLAGVLDLTAAIALSVWRGRTPVQLLQLVASGLLGSDSYNGGTAAAVLGLALHFLIAFGAAAVFYLASRILPVLTQMPVLSGALYGILVFHFMNLIVLPLSAYPHALPFAPGPFLRGILVHIFCVGLPISMVVSRYAKPMEARSGRIAV
jgi:hypothetical protein